MQSQSRAFLVVESDKLALPPGDLEKSTCTTQQGLRAVAENTHAVARRVTARPRMTATEVCMHACLNPPGVELVLRASS
jgi:hypothetical protein